MSTLLHTTATNRVTKVRKSQLTFFICTALLALAAPVEAQNHRLAPLEGTPSYHLGLYTEKGTCALLLACPWGMDAGTNMDIRHRLNTSVLEIHQKYARMHLRYSRTPFTRQQSRHGLPVIDDSFSCGHRFPLRHR